MALFHVLSLLLFCISSCYCESATLFPNYQVSFDIEEGQARLFSIPAKANFEVLRVSVSIAENDTYVAVNAACQFLPTSPFEFYAPLKKDLWSYCQSSQNPLWYISVKSLVKLSNVTLKAELYPPIPIDLNTRYTFDSYNATNGYVLFKTNSLPNFGNSMGIIMPTGFTYSARVESSTQYGTDLNTAVTNPVWYILVTAKLPSFNITVSSSETYVLDDVPRQTLNFTWAPQMYQAYKFTGGLGKVLGVRLETSLRINSNINLGNWFFYNDDGKDRFLFLRNVQTTFQNGTFTFNKVDATLGQYNTSATVSCQLNQAYFIQYPLQDLSDIILVSQTANLTSGIWRSGGNLQVLTGTVTNRQFDVTTGIIYPLQLRILCKNSSPFTYQADQIPATYVNDGDSLTLTLTSASQPKYYYFRGWNTSSLYVEVDSPEINNIKISKSTLNGNTFFGYSTYYPEGRFYVYLTNVATAEATFTFHFKDPIFIPNGVSTFINGSTEYPLMVQVQVPRGPHYYLQATPVFYSVQANTEDIAYAIVTEPTNVTLTLSPSDKIQSGVPFIALANSNKLYELPGARNSTGLIHYTNSVPGSLLQIYGDRIYVETKLNNYTGYIFGGHLTYDSLPWSFAVVATEDVNITLTYVPTIIMCEKSGCPIDSSEPSQTIETSEASSTSNDEPITTNTTKDRTETTIASSTETPSTTEDEHLTKLVGTSQTNEGEDNDASDASVHQFISATIPIFVFLCMN